MSISPTLKAIVERHAADLDVPKYDNIVREAICEQILDELLDTFYKVDITIPSEIVTKELFDYYVSAHVKTEEERERCRQKIHYLINKHQSVIIRTLDIQA